MPEGQGVVITGLGLVLPSGTGLAGAEAVFGGHTSVSFLPLIAGIPGATGAAVRNFQPPSGTESADRAVQFAVSAAEEAWAGADLGRNAPPPEHIATVVSLSKGPLPALAEWAQQAGRSGRDWTSFAPSAAASAIASRLGAAGPVLTPVTACASGGHALIWGASLILRGCADVAVVGAAEASLHPLVIGSYRRMGVLADAAGDPATSVRPFSATRRGFAIGEGAGVLVLESEASAARRGAVALARVEGWATGALACGLAAMEPTGEVLSRIISDALKCAGLAPEAVDYVHAHGTATVDNDVAEARAIRRAFGAAAGRVSVSSTKGSHGHLLGAATAVELVLTVLAMRRGEAPPTVNLTDPDPAIGLDCTPLVARRRPIRCTLKVASGFGGQVAAIVLALPGKE
ncbi:MAG: beta-ketoacyl-[acyl-carrier-protein] synthase family protein [Planctomycetota bacterium]|nr:beta-ketoacyl-[acyl-carrier-protein] synthase family protein [Planctomycetota bacterium]